MAGLEYVNPATMHRNPAFSQGVIVPAGARLLVVGGQNAVTGAGEIIGQGDLAAQTGQALDNLITVLETAGSSLNQLVNITILMVDGQDLRVGYGAWMQRAGNLANPPTVTMAKVAGLAHPDYLIEIAATAIVP